MNLLSLMKPSHGIGLFYDGQVEHKALQIVIIVLEDEMFRNFFGESGYCYEIVTLLNPI